METVGFPVMTIDGDGITAAFVIFGLSQ